MTRIITFCSGTFTCALQLTRIIVLVTFPVFILPVSPGTGNLSSRQKIMTLVFKGCWVKLYIPATL